MKRLLIIALCSMFVTTTVFSQEFKAVPKGSKWGIQDQKGEWTIKPSFYRIRGFGSNFFVWKEKKSYYCDFINGKGDVILSNVHTLGELNYCKTIIERGTRYKGRTSLTNEAIIDTLGKVLYEVDFVTENYSRHGVYDVSGNVIVPVERWNVSFYGDSYFLVEGNITFNNGRCESKQGLWSFDGTQVVPYEFENITPFMNYYFLVRKGHENKTVGELTIYGVRERTVYSLYSNKGKRIAYQYDEIYKSKEDNLIVFKKKTTARSYSLSYVVPETGELFTDKAKALNAASALRSQP